MDADTAGADERKAFPPRPLRGVRAAYIRQGGCPSSFAVVTVDFEPWEEGFVFEVGAHARVPDLPELPSYLEALETGLREQLAALRAEAAEAGAPGEAAVAVVLQELRFHEVDSHENAYREAGRLAVRTACAQLYGPPPSAGREAG